LTLCIALLVYFSQSLGMISKSSVYSDPVLPYVIASLATIPIIAGFQSTKLYEASRNLSLGHVTRMTIVAQIVSLLVMFAWAWLDRSIWALVVGNISSAIATAMLSHVLLPGTGNRWKWDPTAFHEIVHFGKWILLSSVI